MAVRGRPLKDFSDVLVNSSKPFELSEEGYGMGKTENPEINALLEGIRRNEKRHLQMISDNIKLFEK